MATSTIFTNLEIADIESAQKIADALSGESLKISDEVKNSTVINSDKIRKLTEEVLKNV